MPSKSKAQQKFMGMVHATKKGKLKNPSNAVKKAAHSMSKKSAKDYASTSHKGKPNKVKEIAVRKDKEGKMAKFDAKEIAQDASDIFKMIDQYDDLPEWLEAKITKASDYMNGVKDYLTHHQSGVNEENGGVHSGKTCDQVHPNISHEEWEGKLKKENIKIKKSRLIEIIREEALKILVNEDDEPQTGTYGYTSGTTGAGGETANIDLYQKAIKALNLWVAQKGRPSQRTWRGDHEKSFTSVLKKLYPDEWEYVRAKAYTVPVKEIPFYYGQVSGQPKAKSGTGGYSGSETTGKEKPWQRQKGSGIAGKGIK